jgi:hypothetical protein
MSKCSVKLDTILRAPHAGNGLLLFFDVGKNNVHVALTLFISMLVWRTSLAVLQRFVLHEIINQPVAFLQARALL